ncbi:MAG: heavy-metal-associated domain-containing protein [Clostridia bacterium]|nr:heavy-metal-associated domain-containing protein [Clostridia bacterium]
MKSKFKVKGLDCANCAADLERAIQKVDGIESANINFMTEKMEIEYDETRKDEIMQNVKKTIKKEEPDVTIEEV